MQRLAPAWVHQSGARGEQESTPVLGDSVLYYTTPDGPVFAVHAGTGRELWRWQRTADPWYGCCGAVNRGVALDQGRVFVATIDAKLVALRAQDGRLLWQATLAPPDSGYTATMAPLVAGGRVIVGVAGGEYAIRGFVDAYDVRTGRRLWRFWTVPSPDEGGWWGSWSPSTPEGDDLHRDLAGEHADSARYADGWRRGGGGVWTTPAYDAGLGLIYIGVGNPAPAYDASVRPGDNLYTASIVALEAATGRVRWYYQLVPHDRWDTDAANPIVLFDFRRGEEGIPALAHASKRGWVYVLDRRSGSRLLRSEPFVPHENTFAPPTREGVRLQPSVGGGANWTPSSYDPASGLLFVVSRSHAIHLRLAPLELMPRHMYIGGAFEGDTTDPGWIKVSAVDLHSGQLRWQRGGCTTGTMATAGGLLFCGTSRGGWVRALSTRDGKRLWSFQVGGMVHAGGMSYMLDGRQFIAVATEGALFAFALPR